MRRGTISVLGFVVLALLLALLFWNPPPISKTPVVLVVGEFDVANGNKTPADGLYKSLEAARNHRSPPYAAEFIRVSVPDYWDRQSRGQTPSELQQTISELRTALLNEIAQNDVVAILSANTTQTAGPVIEIAETFNIPVLLTVATNDRLLSDRPKAPVIRMVPRDSLQAARIAKWCQAQPIEGAIHVVYDDAPYGRDLFQHVAQQVSREVIGSPIRADGRVSDAIAVTKATPFAAIVFIGYPDQASDFLQWRGKLGAELPTLLSDGCLGPWADDPRISKHNVKLCFPSLLVDGEPRAKVATTREARDCNLGYGPFAVEAAEELDNCIQNSYVRSLPKQTLFSQLLQKRMPTVQESQSPAVSDLRDNPSSQFTIHDFPDRQP